MVEQYRLCIAGAFHKSVIQESRRTRLRLGEAAQLMLVENETISVLRPDRITCQVDASNWRSRAEEAVGEDRHTAKKSYESCHGTFPTNPDGQGVTNEFIEIYNEMPQQLRLLLDNQHVCNDQYLKKKRIKSYFRESSNVAFTKGSFQSLVRHQDRSLNPPPQA